MSPRSVVPSIACVHSLILHFSMFLYFSDNLHFFLSAPFARAVFKALACWDLVCLSPHVTPAHSSRSFDTASRPVTPREGSSLYGLGHYTFRSLRVEIFLLGRFRADPCCSAFFLFGGSLSRLSRFATCCANASFLLLLAAWFCLLYLS